MSAQGLEIDTSDLRERFPVLAKLGRALTPARIPEVRQTAATDCGAASLAMVLGSFGRNVPLHALRDAMAIGRDGVTARAIVESEKTVKRSTTMFFVHWMIEWTTRSPT